jgi:hypothetical protein
MKTIAALVGVVVAGWSQAATAQTLNPCALLTAAEARQAVPRSGPATNDRSLEKYGVSRCHWGEVLVLLLGVGDEPEDPPKVEARTLVEGFVDPLRSSAARSVRFETLAGVGDEAIAVVERRDEAKGFLNDAVILVVRRGKRQVSLLAQGVAGRERAEWLRVLSDLGQAIAKRLN